MIDTPDAAHESGDCIEATELGWNPAEAMLLGDYLGVTPLSPESGLTLFKSIGSVEQDLVLAYHLVREAERLGRGAVIDDVSSLRMMR